MAKTSYDSSKTVGQETDGYDYPDMLMPDAWLERVPPENFIHDGIWLPEYFNITGKELYPDIWNGTELYARSPQEIAEYEESLFLWRTRKGALHLSAIAQGLLADNSDKIGIPKGFVGSHKSGVYFHDKEEENEAFHRKQKTIGTIIGKILNNEIHPFQIGEHGDKAEIREEWWRERGIRFVFEYGYPHGHPTHGIYISKETPKRKEIKPKGITYPEGIWSREAFCLLGEKEGNIDKKVGWLAQRLAEVLVSEPDIEVFTIDSYTGQKEKFGRDFLRSQNAAKWFVEGLIKGQPGEGIYIFVNREQFENFLADRPIKNKEPSPEPENAKPANEEKELSEKQNSAYLNIIGALLGLLLGKSSSNVPYSQFETQQSIIDAIHANYGTGHGLSKRNLEDKFSKAKEKLKPHQ